MQVKAEMLLTDEYEKRSYQSRSASRVAYDVAVSVNSSVGWNLVGILPLVRNACLLLRIEAGDPTYPTVVSVEIEKYIVSVKSQSYSTNDGWVAEKLNCMNMK